ncbi:MAG TPA: hypothetical protein VEU30_15625, partial [Thermoanaerobaculia bacterium]|nr:hypothetical protein [Thermoanaerobaculia bacterium]
VASSTETAIAGATAQSLRVTPDATTTYRVRVSNSCGNATSQAVVTVLPLPTVPASVTATYNPVTNANVITWAASTSSAGIAAYLVERRPGSLQINVTSGTTYTDTAIVPGVTYVYTVRSRDINSAYSDKSATEVATTRTFTDDPIVGATPTAGTAIRGIHLGELRQAIDSVRAAGGLLPAWTSYAAATGVVDADQFIEMRDRLNEARDQLGLPHVFFTQPVNATQVVRGSALIELRNGVK